MTEELIWIIITNPMNLFKDDNDIDIHFHECITCCICAIMISSMMTDVRLVDGPNEYSGRLEMFQYGIWGTVCMDWYDETWVL